MSPSEARKAVKELAKIVESPCRSCGIDKPAGEVCTSFKVWGKWRVRFKMCQECRKKANKSYRRKPKEKP